MKKILPIMLVLLLACNDDEPVPENEIKTELTVRVRQGTTFIDSEPAISIMWIYKKRGSEFLLPAATDLLASGVVRDDQGVMHQPHIKKERLSGVYINQLDSGTYMIAVMLPNSLRYSTTEVKIDTGQQIALNKIFPDEGSEGQHEGW